MEKKYRPPKPFVSLLERIILPQDRESLPGDFEEEYNYITHDKGVNNAIMWYLLNSIKLIPTFIKNSFIWSLIMFKNYLKIALRNIKNHKGYSFINISGLSIGLTCCILILLFVRNELSFDKFHKNSDQIYRIFTENEHSGEPFYMAPTMLPLAPALHSDFPEILRVVRVSQKNSVLMSSGDTKFYERFLYVDQDFFKIFTFSLISGDPETALSEPYSVIITQDAAEKYFGSENPLGKMMTIQNDQAYKVTGILKKVPPNTHMRFTVLASFSSLNNTERVKNNNWTSFSNDYTYIMLQDEVDPGGLEKKFPAFLKKYMEPDAVRQYKLHLQPLTEIYFSSLAYDYARTYEKNYLYAFSVVAFFILLIACINFMNLTTARSSGRAKEVGLRKVAGAYRNQLIKQFLAKSVYLSLLALIIAVILVFLILPEFNNLIRRRISISLYNDFSLFAGFFGISVIAGLLSGSYPAFFLSAFQPVKVLKGAIAKGSKIISFRTVFVVAQFTISTVLIIATIIVFDQLNYMKTKELGFEKNQIIVIDVPHVVSVDQYEALKAKLLQNPSILSASATNGAPGSGRTNSSNYKAEDLPDGEDIYMQTISCDYDFIATMGLEIKEGRNFSKEFTTDESVAYLINETAVNKIGWDSPVGKWISLGGTENRGNIIGVVKDFHYRSVHAQIEPTVLKIDFSRIGFVTLKIKPFDISRTLSFVEEKWKEFSPHYPLDYYFMDEQFENYYRFEQRLGILFTQCSLLAIFVSCLGIFGMISFTAEQRRKEIGIRKVLGSSISGIVLMLSKELFRWILIANIIAWPLAYYCMNKWLQQFAYRTVPSLSSFVLAGVLTLVIALLTVTYQTVKAAIANPVDALKCE